MWSHKTTWSKYQETLWVVALCQHPAKFGSHRHCGSGDMLSLVAEEEDSRWSCFNPQLLFIRTWIESTLAYYINYSDPVYTRLKQQLKAHYQVWDNFWQLKAL